VQVIARRATARRPERLNLTLRRAGQVKQERQESETESAKHSQLLFAVRRKLCAFLTYTQQHLDTRTKNLIVLVPSTMYY
jgi:hypothetical protein